MSAQEHQDADIALALLAEMKRPDTFQLLVDRLPPSPERVGLRLWGALYGVYTVTDELSR